LLQLQNIILEMVAKGEALAATADRLCVEVENRLPGIICSILRVDLGSLHPLSAPSLPAEFTAALEGLAIGPDVGSCGSAAFCGAAVAVTDIENDSRWTDYKSLALPLGIKACWSSPICDGQGHVLGTFAFYYFEKRGPSIQEHKVVETCVNLCAIALERHERVLERERRTYVDALTDLPNRASFNEVLSRLSCDDPGSWAFLLLDLDNLKFVNDTFGHHAGDDLLQLAAKRIAEAARPNSAFRLGGDEFAVLVKGFDAVNDLEAAAGRLRDALSQPADRDQHAILPSATIGAAVLSAADGTADVVHRNADLALYHAKETDRGGFVRHSPDLGTAMTHRVGAIREVASALAEGRIEAFYQPIFRLDTRAVVGVEALWRLINGRGEVSQGAAIQEAMKDARIASRLTRRMLTAVASDVRAWLALEGSLQHVSLNVSTADFHGGGFVEDLAEAFHREDVPLKHVILKVTEPVHMRRRDHVVARAFATMRARGVRIALDHFGTGFASLTDLLTGSVDILRIDRSLIDRLAPDDASVMVVEGLIGIASQLGIQSLAEGVETEGQAGQLRRFGCTLGQGHLFSEALPRELVTTMLLGSARPGHDPAATALRRADHGSDPRGAVPRGQVLTSAGFAVLPSP